ncbi:unnamed protein product [Brachionus calyciflorus]|uniref:Cilia- and flagella-associated protein 61 N-terminal domain-containing protein n=1 Tax=Brachionus calyciflorus TaxID=104777 RepID=A0A813SUX0_9BILA|nr:unnamed protein product [Brachionus calyciflorus]
MSNKKLHGSLITTARRTEATDAKEILRYINNHTLELFGPNCKEIGTIHEIIEKSILSITLEDQNTNRVIAQACFNDYPNVYGVNPADWESWLNIRYDASKNTPLNTLFLHFFASQNEFSISCAQEIIKSAFKAVPECHYILLCIPINTVQEPSLASMFNEMKRNNNTDAAKDPKCIVYVTNRENHIPVLHIRDANVHDNDDLIPLFNSCTDLLKATYGDFYVAELIEAQNEQNKCLTAEAEGFGIGFMALTTDVNVELLNECFELRPFHGLCVPHPNDELTPVANSDNYEPVIKHKLSEAGIMDSDELDNEFNTEQSGSNQSEYSSNKEARIQKENYVPKYCGESNAFSIQLFCIEEKYDSRSLDFLPKAFDLFPDKDYCIITLPQNVPEFSLIQNFIRITPRNTNKINQELYLFHRAGLIKSLKVRSALKSGDYESIEKLVHNISSKDSILNDLQSYLKSRKDANGIDIDVYVAEIMNRIVGVAVIRQEDDIEYLRSNFNIENFIMFNHHKRDQHGHINHLALIPIFSFLTKYFIREILRKSSKTCLYYPIYPEYAPSDISERYSLITAMNYMVPVPRRKQIDYNFSKLGVNAPSDLVLKSRHNYSMPCALNMINRKLLLEPKLVVNLRIVVVGASVVGLSFLEKLIFSPHLRFNNLTLVSTTGAPGTLPPDSLRDQMNLKSMNYDSEDYAALSLRSWVNIITGKMTWIDRRRKHIVINGHTQLPYDHLILCTGEQYYHLAPLDLKVYNPYTKQDIKSSPSRPLFDEPPENMFVLNSEVEAENVLQFMEKYKIEQMKESVVVYGLDLNALCAIQTLIQYGISPSRFIVVCDKNSLNEMNNPYVIEKVMNALAELDIKVYENYQMLNWNGNKWTSGDLVRSISFKKSPTQNDSGSVYLDVQCCMILCYYKKDVDYITFTAVNKCHLVYDGRLVIDNDFHTNDSCIRAAGKMTKFKRSYYVDTWSHACFNQKEIGQDLAYRILKLVDPLLINDEPEPNYKSDSHRLANNDPSDNVLIQLYKKPNVYYAILPGGLYYLHVTKPGLTVTYKEEAQENDELVTNTENGYFRIHLNKHKCVQTITCLSKKKFNASNYIKLYGFHEQYLNRLLTKFNQRNIKDFYVYFNDNWTHALYHDRFDDLTQEIRDISINPNNGIKSVYDLLNEFVDKDLILTKDQREKIIEHFRNSGTRSLVEKRLLSYLNYNYSNLPMYAKPDMV